MGVGGKFWALLKPYARFEGFDYLREKRVAVDLSFWIVQQETAVGNNVRNPHLRLTFFRTINLFSKLGAYPIFVVDGTPSPLKSAARIARFFRSSGVDGSGLPVAEEGVSVERNRRFLKCVQECVELLELLGMPVITAKGEAEALCAELNHQGLVDACITADSDAFLFGATCVIKSIKPNSKEPLECYHMGDIEVGLCLKRKHLIAISLLVGNDHDLGGVQGIGIETALRFVREFNEDEILHKLHEIGNGDKPTFRSGMTSESLSEEISPAKRTPHCSFCGHPGTKRAHLNDSCEFCLTVNGGCTEKPLGFICECSFCIKCRQEKEQKKNDDWWSKVCTKIALEPNFPNDQIIKLYLCDSNQDLTESNDLSTSWKSPSIEMLVDFLGFHLQWKPAYIRKMTLPMLSTIFMRETATNTVKSLLCDQYDFHSIQRIKTKYGHPLFVVKWEKENKENASAKNCGSVNHTPLAQETNSMLIEEEVTEAEEAIDSFDAFDEPEIHVDEVCSVLLTEESMELVRSAFPDEVFLFMQEKELSKQKSTPTLKPEELPKPSGVQLSIKEFYRSTKTKPKPCEITPNNNNVGSSQMVSKENRKEKRKGISSKISKSVRRRLLFD